jgi:hypothetical protein
MDSNGKLFPKGGPEPKSELLTAYEEITAGGFKDLDRFSNEDLGWLQHIHDRHLDFFREERRMHFGAFALVGLAFIILLPATLFLEDYFLILAGAQAMLLALLVPYVFVYRKYEEGVRRMMREAIILENVRRLRVEKGS